jgi:opacity protein-like surface antigen
MILRCLRFLTAGLLFAFAASTHAQAVGQGPWYVTAGVGATFYDDMVFSGAVAGDISMGTGYSGNVAVGRFMDDKRVLRLEFEGIYSQASINNSAGFKTGGDLSNGSVMFNFIYNIHTGTNSPWVPYIGGGLGYSYVTVSDLTDTATGTVLVDGSDGVFAYQFRAGVAYKFSPDWALTMAYRYIATDNLGFATNTPGTANSGGTRSHNAELGFRFNF